MVKFRQYIRQGDKGRDVSAVKDGLRRMKAQGANKLGRNDQAGLAFVQVLKNVQKNHNLHDDGIYGPATHNIVAKHFNLWDNLRYRTAKIRKHQTVSKNAGGFLPEGVKFVYDRHDQGRDIQTGIGQKIIAPGRGHVVRVNYDPGDNGGHFGPKYPVVEFATGPYAGKEIYIGHTISALREGDSFNLNDTLSHTQKSGPLNGGAPDGWAEIGYAQNGIPGPFGQPAPF